MIDTWIPLTARMLPEIVERGVSGTGTYTDRAYAARAAVAMALSDPEGPTMPLLIGKPIHVVGPEGLRPQLAIDGDIMFDYVNWRGERGQRRATGPYAIRYGTSEFHEKPQFLLSAVDLDRGQTREYALSDMVPKNL